MKQSERKYLEFRYKIQQLADRCFQKDEKNFILPIEELDLPEIHWPENAIPCEKCSGLGKITCSTCQGSKKINCSKCKAKGKITRKVSKTKSCNNCLAKRKSINAEINRLLRTPGVKVALKLSRTSVAKYKEKIVAKARKKGQLKCSNVKHCKNHDVWVRTGKIHYKTSIKEVCSHCTGKGNNDCQDCQNGEVECEVCQGNAVTSSSSQ